MLKNKRTDAICIGVFAAALLLSFVYLFGERLGMQRMSSEPEYAVKFFDDSYVHNIDIRTDSWEEFIDRAGEEEYISCNMEIDGETIKNVGLRVKGNNSKSLVKKYNLERYSLKIEFDHYNKDQKFQGLDKMNLDCSFQDNSYMKNYIAYDMMRHMNVPSPLCTYTEVTVNGENLGLFLAVEEPEESFARRNFGKNHGKLYKPDYRNVNHENRDVALEYIDENHASYDNIFRKAKFERTREDEQRIIDALKILESGENLQEAVDIDEVIRYFTVQVFVVNLDSYLGPTGHNYFLYEKDGRLSILPWDYNLAFCTYSLGMPNPVNDAELYVNYPIDTPAWKEVMLKRPMYHKLMSHEKYYNMYHSYFSYFIDSYVRSGKLEEKIEKTAAMISPYVKKDSTAFCSYEDFILGADTLKQFCLLRGESVRKQLDGEIPSTIRGQSTDKSGFINADSIWLPDMGEIADLKD